MTYSEAMQKLEEAVDAAEAADAAITAAVIAAKETGASWAAIAATLGVTKQRAHQKYAAVATAPDFAAAITESNAASKKTHTATAAEDKQRLAEYATAAKQKANQDAAAHVEATAIFLDGTAPAKTKKAPKTPTTTGVEPLPEYTNPLHWGTDDWKQDDPIHFLTPLHERHFGKCKHCDQKHHRQPGGGTWIYPGCLPTTSDPIYTL